MQLVFLSEGSYLVQELNSFKMVLGYIVVGGPPSDYELTLELV